MKKIKKIEEISSYINGQSLVAFHIGRGGRFHNGGYKSFVSFNQPINKLEDLYQPMVALDALEWTKDGMSSEGEDISIFEHRVIDGVYQSTGEVSEETRAEIDAYMEEIAQAMAECVGEEFGEEYGNAFRGYVDNGQGIWFEGIEVDPEKFDEIRDFCINLVADSDWRKEVAGDHLVDNFAADAYMNCENGNGAGITCKDYALGLGYVDYDGDYNTTYVKRVESLYEDECLVLMKELTGNYVSYADMDILKAVIEAGFEPLVKDWLEKVDEDEDEE